MFLPQDDHNLAKLRIRRESEDSDESASDEDSYEEIDDNDSNEYSSEESSEESKEDCDDDYDGGETIFYICNVINIGLIMSYGSRKYCYHFPH